ncbi:MAG: hypothetical protein ACI83O_000586 [Patescibacteria group bacterium]|jgi:hypothetical protein
MEQITFEISQKLRQALEDYRRNSSESYENTWKIG